MGGGWRTARRETSRVTAGVDYDVDVIGGRQALDKIRDALDSLLDKSPFSASAIEKLLGNGEVLIVYDPSHPDKVASNFLGVTLAKFHPNLFDNAASKVGAIDFPVVIGRYLVKWPRDEVAGAQPIGKTLGAGEESSPRNRDDVLSIYSGHQWSKGRLTMP